MALRFFVLPLRNFVKLFRVKPQSRKGHRLEINQKKEAISGFLSNSL
jgi:hypothetical protein